MALTEQWWDIRTDRWYPWKHHHHHKPRPTAPRFSGITIKEKPMPTIAGVTLPTVDITVTLPTTRVDGTAGCEWIDADAGSDPQFDGSSERSS